MGSSMDLNHEVERRSFGLGVVTETDYAHELVLKNFASVAVPHSKDQGPTVYTFARLSELPLLHCVVKGIRYCLLSRYRSLTLYVSPLFWLWC